MDNSLSNEDKEYIPKYLINVRPLPEKPTYSDELAFIIAVQRSVLNIAPGNEGLPFDQNERLKNLYEEKTGACFDRSRVIEMILRYSGFDTRHVSLYSEKETGSAIESLMLPGTPSHAVTEVLTKEGWLVVDSNAPWVSLDVKKLPVSIEDMQSSAQDSIAIDWDVKPPWDIYLEPFTYVYGLYSRHGRFYPPYDPIPDVNYGELVQNIF